MKSSCLVAVLLVITALLKTAVGDECDPAVYQTINDAGRSQDDTYQTNDAGTRCDRDELTPGWYRFVGAGGIAMSDTCIPVKRCRTHATGHLDGGHPTFAEGTVTRKVCYRWGVNCCQWSNSIKVRNCGDFYVYGLEKSPECKLRYCTNPNAIAPTPPPVNGGWSAWNEGDACSKTCGGGEKTQSRACNNPEPSHGGNNCEGETTRTVPCNEVSCAVDGGWSEWGEWGACSKTCGGGEKEKSRKCNNPAPVNNGKNCQGEAKKTTPCNEETCEPDKVDGRWTKWSKWGDCSVTCGKGNKQRTRTCTNPSPSNGGENCAGENKKTTACNKPTCENNVDGGWTAWSKWGDCSVTCSKGKKQRSRTCTNPPRSGKGKKCKGRDTKNKKCNEGTCEIPLDYLGCFKEGKPLSVSVLLKNFKGTFKTSQGNKVTQACAQLAQAKGWKHFAIGGKDGLSCYSGADAGKNYKKGGKGKKCSKKGTSLGKKGDIAVYKIKQ